MRHLLRRRPRTPGRVRLTARLARHRPPASRGWLERTAGALRRAEGSASETFMMFVPLAVLAAFVLFSAGGTGDLLRTVDRVLTGWARAVSAWVAALFT